MPHRPQQVFVATALACVTLIGGCKGPEGPDPIGPPASIAKQGGDNQAAIAGAAVATPPSVVVRDASGRAVPDASVNFAIASGDGSISGGAAKTNASGIAAVGSWTLGARAGSNTLSATVSGLQPVIFAATGKAGPASRGAAHAGDNQSAVVGSAVAIAPAILVSDANGNPVADVAVNFSVASGGGSATGTEAKTNAEGIAAVGAWSLGPQAGANTLSASAAGFEPVVFVALGTAGAAANVGKHAGDNQSAAVASAVAAPPAVLVTDQYGNMVAGVAVKFAVASGDGSISAADAITNPSGVATVGSWTLGKRAGANSLSASVAGLQAVAFTAIGVAGSAAQPAKHAGDGQTATAGSAVPVAPAVLISDEHGNPVSGVAVTFEIAEGGGSVAGSPAMTNAQGIAAVGAWMLGPKAGPNSLVARAAGLPAVMFAASGVAGKPASLARAAGNDQRAVAGAAVPIPPAVVVRDQHENPVAGIRVSFAVTLGGGKITGASATTNAEGLAAVGSWELGPLAGPNALTAAVDGLESVVFNASGTPGGPASLAKHAGDRQTAQVGSAVAVAPAVIVRDGNGNPVAGVEVTFEVATGGGEISGPKAARSDNGGVAAVGSWKLGTRAGPNTLRASVGKELQVIFAATGLPGPAAQLSKHAGDNQKGAVSSAVATPAAVVVRDQYGNPVPGITVTFVVEDGGGSISGDTPLTNAQGIAAIGSWTLGPEPGRNTVRASPAAAPAPLVIFTAVALPCEVAGSRAPLAIPSSVDGTLASPDCLRSGKRFVDLYSVALDAGASAIYEFAMRSTELNSVLELWDGQGLTKVGLNDDRAVADPNSTLRVLAAAGSYRLLPTSRDERSGRYSLSAKTSDPVITGCPQVVEDMVWITPALDTDQKLENGDCVTQIFVSYSDRLAIWMVAGRTYTITMMSATVDPSLTLTKSGGGAVGDREDDNSRPDWTSRVVFTPSEDGAYIIAAGSTIHFFGGRPTSGPYKLSVTVSEPAPAPAANAFRRGG